MNHFLNRSEHTRVGWIARNGADVVSMNASHHKRKQPDELVADLLSNVRISSTKKFRLDNGLYPIIEEPHVVTSTDTTPLVLSKDRHLSPLETSLFCGSIAKVADEKAIVLYKPVNPPLFPGGPPAGSSELPLRLKSLLSDKVRLSVSPFSASDTRYGDYLSSLYNTHSSERDAAPVEFKEQPDNSLAVIQWVPPSPVLSSCNGIVQTQNPNAALGLPNDGQAIHHEDEVDEMTIDEEEEMVIEEEDKNTNSTHWDNPLPDLNTSSLHLSFQPPCTSSMWSV